MPKSRGRPWGPILLAVLLLVGTAAVSAPEEGRQAVSDDRSADVDAGRCSLTGGGCLNEEGGVRRQSTFGGSVEMERGSPATEGHTWQHVDRDGRTVTFDFLSHDARLVRCRPAPAGRCPSHVMDVRVEMDGTGAAKFAAGGPTVNANFVAEIIDHREGGCATEGRDFYSITVRSGGWIGQGEVLFETSGEIDCGNLLVAGSRPGSR